jgi:hypothetical protein
MEDLRIARRQAVAMAVFSSIAVIALSFGYIQYQKASELETVNSQLAGRLKECEQIRLELEHENRLRLEMSRQESSQLK